MLNLPKNRDAELLAYMKERESIRERKESGEPPPWTDDPILQEYRFTNIRREHDAVTIWIRENWKRPHADDPYLWFALMVARLLNLPQSMAALSYPVPWNPERWTAVLHDREANGQTIFGSAYRIGTGSKEAPDGQIVFFRNNLLTPIWQRRKQITSELRGATLAEAAKVFMSCPGFAGFMAGQVIHDLKWTPILRKAKDWRTWATPGPGSGPGMNRLLYRPAGTAAAWKGREDAWLRLLHDLQRRLDPKLEAAGLPELCAQNLQHNLCEANKLWRAQSGEGMPKRRYKTPNSGGLFVSLFEK